MNGILSPVLSEAIFATSDAFIMLSFRENMRAVFFTILSRDGLGRRFSNFVAK
jgi:hypothetical protein